MLIDVFCDTSQRFKVLFNMQAVLTLQAVTLQRLPQWYLCAAMVHQPPGLLLAVTRVARSNVDAQTPLYSKASYEQTGQAAGQQL